MDMCITRHTVYWGPNNRGTLVSGTERIRVVIRITNRGRGCGTSERGVLFIFHYETVYAYETSIHIKLLSMCNLRGVYRLFTLFYLPFLLRLVSLSGKDSP